MELLILPSILIGLMLIRVPIAFCMGITALASLIMSGISPIVVAQRLFYGVDSFPLLAIPLFIFAGEAMNTSGVTDRIFNFARAFVRHIIGSLGHVNVISSMIISGMSGSAVSDAYGVGVVTIKVMRKHGFGGAFSAALTAASSTVGPIIPPSIPLVIFAIITEQSVGRLFVGGFIPGVLMGLALMVLVYFTAKKRNYAVEPKATGRERWDATRNAIPSLLAPIIMFSGIVFGIVTPTEAAAITGVYALFLGFAIHKELKFSDLYRMLLVTAKSTSTILLIVASASIVTWTAMSSGLPEMVTNGLLSLTENKYLLLILINVILLILGCFLESISIIMIMTPVLMPIMERLHVDPIHFGLFFVLNISIGLITPPVGMCLYVVKNVAQLPFEDIVKEVIPMLIPLVIVLGIVIFVPQTVLWLPNLIMGK